MSNAQTRLVDIDDGFVDWLDLIHQLSHQWPRQGLTHLIGAQLINLG